MQKFVEKFKNINGKNGFYNFATYVGDIGFSIQKDLSTSDTKNASLLKFYIPKNNNISEEKKSVIITANYGEKVEGGISLRSGENKIDSPVDLISNDDFYYNQLQDKLFTKSGKEISPIDLINKIYWDHIKPTKLVRGFWIRVKIVFWKKFISKVLNYLATFFHNILYIITGDKYSYEAVLDEEVLNNVILSHRWKEMIGQKKDNPKMRDNLEPSIKFDFFGYKASYWIIIFYSIINLSLYIIFEWTNWKPLIVTTIFKNNFLTLIYVISSLWAVEILIPKILKFLIKINSKLSVKALYRKIKI